MKKLKALLGVFLLVLPLGLTGCSDKTKVTLDRAGAFGVNFTTAFNDQILALKAAGAAPDKIRAWEDAGRRLKIATDSVRDYLSGLKEVNERDIAQVTGKIGQALAIVNGLLTNPDFLALGDSSLLVQLTKYGAVGFTQASLTLGVFFPPKPPGAAVAESGGKTVPVKSVVIEVPAPPPAVALLLQAAGGK